MTATTLRIIAGLALMATSNGVAWHMVLSKESSPSSPAASLSGLRSKVWKIALFYTLWALYNRYLGGRIQELGHVSFGLLLLACLSTAWLHASRTRSEATTAAAAATYATRLPLIVFCGLVVLNFAIVLPMILTNGPTGMADLVWNNNNNAGFFKTLWGYVFSIYITSNVVLWSYCCYGFWKLPLIDNGDDEYDRHGYSYSIPTIDAVDYEPVESADV